MSNTQLATSRPEDQARAKAEFLYRAIQQIAQVGVEIDLATGLTAVLARVTRAFNLSQRDPLYTPKAQAIAIVTINLGLEYATGGDLDKAIKALTRNPIEMIYAIGEKVTDELRKRVIQVQADAFVSARRDNGVTIYFGVTDQATETQLQNWVIKGLCDHPFLPVGSMTEVNVINAVLDRVVRETALAKKIGWNQILGSDSEAARFSSKIFARRHKDESNTQGGIWKPFLLTLIMQAMTDGWNRNRNSIAFVDRHAIIEFLDLVNNHFDEINDRAGLAIMRITQVATRKYGDIVRSAFTPDEIEEIFSFAQSCLFELSEQAQAFYAAHNDEEILNVEVVDRFWRERLFLSSTIPYDVRIAESSAAWEKASQMKTLAALTRLVRDFKSWPVEAQIKFFKELNLNPLIDGIDRADAQAKALYELFKALEANETSFANTRTVVLQGINWSQRINLLIALQQEEAFKRFGPAIVAAAELINWNFQQILALRQNNASRAYLGAALRHVDTPLTEGQWAKVYELASSDCGFSIAQVWGAISKEQQNRDFMKFTAREFSSMASVWTWEKVRDFFEPILKLHGTSQAFREQFRNWYAGLTNRSYEFIPSKNWDKRLEELFHQYLGWKTREDIFFESLPAGHPKRKLFDRRLNTATIAQIEKDQPWLQLSSIKSWDELCEALKNFVLWPEKEQDSLAFSVFRADQLLDQLSSPEEQAAAVVRLSKAMDGPYKNSEYVATLLAKLINWKDRSELALILLTDRTQPRASIKVITADVTWPVTLSQELLGDTDLLKVALSNMRTPTTDVEWKNLCRVCSEVGLWAAVKAWNKMSARQKKQFFMDFTAQQLSGLLLDLTETDIYNFFTEVLDEHDSDEIFRAEFKLWFQGGRQGRTKFFTLKEWEERLSKLFEDRLGWIAEDESQPKKEKKSPREVGDQINLLVAGDNLEQQLDQIVGANAQAKALTVLWKSLDGKNNPQVIRDSCEQIDWSDRGDLILELNRTFFQIKDDLFYDLTRQARWSYLQIKKIHRLAGNKARHSRMILIAIQGAEPTLTLEDWAHAISKAGLYNPELSKGLWKLMNDEQRQKLFMKFTGKFVSEIFSNEPWEVVSRFFTAVLSGPNRHQNYTVMFQNWYFGDKSQFGQAHAFKPATAWSGEIDNLICELLYGIKAKPKG